MLGVYMFLCVFVLVQTEQLKELKQELIKHEEQLREVKKNSTTLERKLEYERYVRYPHIRLYSISTAEYLP